jgi:hypothetical protein
MAGAGTFESQTDTIMNASANPGVDCAHLQL